MEVKPTQNVGERGKGLIEDKLVSSHSYAECLNRATAYRELFKISIIGLSLYYFSSFI